MKINFDKNIQSIDGTALLEQGSNGEIKNVQMKDLIVAALLSNQSDEPNLSGQVKFARGKLAEKVYAGGDLDLPVEDVSCIKEIIGKFCTPLVVFQIFDYIEGTKLAATAPATS